LPVAIDEDAACGGLWAVLQEVRRSDAISRGVRRFTVGQFLFS
jgi:hypothetical protein